MGDVWLIYEDDYGGLFSPLILTGLFYNEHSARDAACGVDRHVVRHDDLGPDLDDYPQTWGGLFSDD